MKKRCRVLATLTLLIGLAFGLSGCCKNRFSHEAQEANVTLGQSETFVSRDSSGLLINPSFAATRSEAKAQLARVAQMPVPLDRPLVICGGFMDFGLGPWLMERKLRRYVSGRIILVSFATCGSLEDCRSRLVRRIDKALGDVDPQTTAEVDVIGQSMGGLIAVHAALDASALGKRVRLRTLYTICSPLQGAKLATATSFDVFRYQRDMRPHSALYERLSNQKRDYEIVSYSRLRDDKVGEEYSALPGTRSWWVDTPSNEDTHDRADFDPRIILDIVLRLRREKPMATEPPAELPTRHN